VDLHADGGLSGDPNGNGFVHWDSGVTSFAFGPDGNLHYVVDAPLTGTGASLTGTAGQSFSFEIATFIEGANGTASQFTATINWGDGQASPGTVAANGRGGFNVTGTHTYTESGPYSTTVTIMDIGGGNTTMITSTIHVARAGAPPARLMQVSEALTHSREYYTDFVTQAYWQYLRRSPDAAGLSGWVGAMLSGSVSDEQLEAQFIGSVEYIQSHGGSGAEWVRQMYQDLLGRQPSDAEVQAWVAYLDQGGSPMTVAYDFASSPEREAIRIRSDYQAYLGRSVSDAEVAGWVSAFNHHQVTNEDVIGGFIGSGEYYQKHYANPRDWLFSAYDDVLSRVPTQADYNAWLPFLATP
jgi:hypothetical protein